jgi:hypothetical protein
MNDTKWQEHSDRHVFDHLHTTGSNKSFVSTQEQQGILSVKSQILIVYSTLQQCFSLLPWQHTKMYCSLVSDSMTDHAIIPCT